MSEHGKNKSFAESLRHAASGVRYAFLSERNMRFHAAASVAVIAASVVLRLSPSDKAIVYFLCAAVICAELFNTAIENAVDLSSPVFNMYAKRAKDLAAGAVLVMSIGAAVCGLVIFIPYIISFISFFM